LQKSRPISIIILRGAAWTSLTIIIVLTFVPPTLRPVSGMPHTVEHFAIFFLTGALFAIAYEVRVSLLLIAAVIFCVCLELLQSYVPGRHARLSDAIVDASSACMGIALARAGHQLLNLIKNRKRNRALG
jgi:VanZ family protein